MFLHFYCDSASPRRSVRHRIRVGGPNLRTWLALLMIVAYSLSRRKEAVVAWPCVRLQAVEVGRRTYPVIGMEKQYDEDVAIEIEVNCR